MDFLGFDLGRHGGYVLAAYVVVAFAVTGLLVWIRADRRRLEREMAELEAAGVRRRSQRAKPVQTD
ncbi:heme exporter protein CcmD [Polycladidibacter hongkongensis]|uniref:heme exporter protein CcmD n=1 Tax=Polycladidibacter hongkongensis TaxID=1647556 RepID=UPI0008348CA8|nr:heme exporter protein CcmD [Pseudovibrio hongkongensis]